MRVATKRRIDAIMETVYGRAESKAIRIWYNFYKLNHTQYCFVVEICLMSFRLFYPRKYGTKRVFKPTMPNYAEMWVGKLVTKQMKFYFKI